jgi:hypothetical protein
MNKYNITAQVYNKFDSHKQTMLLNEIISANSQEDAKKTFREIYDTDHEIIKIYSAEEISKV